MKELIKNYIIIAFLVMLVLFCIRYVLANPTRNELLKSIGSIFEDVEEGTGKSNSHLLLKDVIEEETPKVKYIGGTRNVGELIHFKELIAVCLSGENYQVGTVEEGFYVYFEDIRDNYGNSIVTYLDTEEIEALEEIPTAFIFDKKREELHFHKSGTFLMYINVYTETGSCITYECKLPVEIN